MWNFIFVFVNTFSMLYFWKSLHELIGIVYHEMQGRREKE